MRCLSATEIMAIMVAPPQPKWFWIAPHTAGTFSKKEQKAPIKNKIK